MEGCKDLLRSYIIDKVLYATDGLSQNEQPFLNLLPDYKISTTPIIVNNIEQVRARVESDRDKQSVSERSEVYSFYKLYVNKSLFLSLCECSFLLFFADN